MPLPMMLLALVLIGFVLFLLVLVFALMGANHATPRPDDE